MNATQLTTYDSAISVRGVWVKCYRMSITKWIVGALVSKALKSPPLMAVCQSVDIPYCDRKFELDFLNTTSYLNVYEHILKAPSVIRNGDKHFIKVHSSQIYYQRCALKNCVDRPLVAVELGGKLTLYFVWLSNNSVHVRVPCPL